MWIFTNTYFHPKQRGIIYHDFKEKEQLGSEYLWLMREDENGNQYKKLVKEEKLSAAIFDAVDKVFEDI